MEEKSIDGTARPDDGPAAGRHLIADFWGVETIDSIEELDALVRAAVASAGATLLDIAFHQFPVHAPGGGPVGDHGGGPGGGSGGGPGGGPGGGSGGGITGYALLAESHISLHTWPERDYVAIDVFMCGGQRPEDSLEILRRAFSPASEEIRSVERGVRREGIIAPSARPLDGLGTRDASRPLEARRAAVGTR